jgi:class 3 adenylate cyclase
MLKFIRQIGTSPNDSEELLLKKYVAMIVAVGCCIAATIWTAIYYLIGCHIAAIGPLIYIACVFPAIIYFSVTKKAEALINAQLFAIYFCPTFMEWTSGGFVNGCAIVLWTFLAPLSALLFYDIAKARIWVVIMLSSIVLTAFFDDYIKRLGPEINNNVKPYITAMNLVGPTGIMFFAMQYFLKTITKNSALLKEEKHKSDRLLLNILPAKIAEELKTTGKASPMKYTAATVIFSDFTDFTKIAEELTHEQLIEELDYCFKAFDDIITKFGIEKIKTIGDAYMCVAGVPVSMDDGTVLAVHAALEMAEFIRQIKEQKNTTGKPYWDVRLGIHTGDVIAGIVGGKKFAYDIWGDAVNIASRMESSSAAGKVNISGATYDLVKEHFKCKYRGQIPAKNKGFIDMYFVEKPMVG